MYAVRGYDSLRHGSKSDLFSITAPLAIYNFLAIRFTVESCAILLQHSPSMMGHGVVVFSADGCYLPVGDAALPSRLQLR